MTKYIMGIDPGVNGAIAVVNSKNYSEVLPIPNKKRGKTGNKKEVDAKAFYKLFNFLYELAKNDCKHIKDISIYLENVHALPQSGGVQMFGMGQSLGVIKGVVACFDLELVLVTPQRWKKYFALSRDKNKSLELARELFPNNAHKLQLKKSADMAEALLIAQYGLEQEAKHE